MRAACYGLFFLGIVFLIHACGGESSQEPEKMIVNTWRLKEFTPSEKYPMSDSIIQEIIDKTVIEFMPDGKFKQTGIGRTHTGTYSISPDGKTITYDHDERDASFKESVLEFTTKKMKVVDQNGNKMTRVN